MKIWILKTDKNKNPLLQRTHKEEPMFSMGLNHWKNSLKKTPLLQRTP
jgi:hypothetical protein